MEYRRLGKSGLKVSELSLGTWVTFAKQVDHKDALALMGLAYDDGINSSTMPKATKPANPKR